MRTQPLGKYFSRVVGEDGGVLCYAKYVARQNAAGVDVTAATIQRTANTLVFLVNAAAEVVIGTYTGATGAANVITFVDANIASVRNLIDTINGLGAGMVAAGTTFNRWKAGPGDYRPGYVIGAGDVTALAAANALLGEDHIGFPILVNQTNHASVDLMSCGIPIIGTARGTGPRLPDHFESDYSSTVAGVVTRNRQSQMRRQEEQPMSETQVLIDTIMTPQFGTTTVVEVYDDADNLIWRWAGGAAVLQVPAGVLSEDNPIVGPMGRSLYVEVSGTGAYVATTSLTVAGQVRIA